MVESHENKRRWAAVEFTVSPDKEDLAGWLVMHCGATGCRIDPLNDGRLLIHGDFDRAELSEAEIATLESSFELYGLAECLHSLRLSYVEEQDWLSEWKKGFEPFPVGERFLVAPSWCRDTLEPALAAGREILWIEPGMAFGTGLHATTRYCLRALERVLGQGQIDVVDVGTGSGILAMGAARLNPDARIVAIDVDPVAVKVARENLELNRLVERVELGEGSTEVLASQGFDCILSNLTCEDIVALLIDYLRILRPGGVVICAGILKEKLPLLEDALETYPLSIVEREIDEMWAGVTLTRIPVVIKTA